MKDGQIDLFESRAERDRALDKVERNAKDWMGTAITTMIYVDWPEEVTGEDIRITMTELGVVPHHPNAWGALIRTCLKRGLLVRTGRWTNMREVSSHARMTPIYRITA